MSSLLLRLDRRPAWMAAAISATLARHHAMTAGSSGSAVLRQSNGAVDACVFATWAGGVSQQQAQDSRHRQQAQAAADDGRISLHTGGTAQEGVVEAPEVTDRLR